MYCPINNPEQQCECTSKCCRLYNIALGFLAVLILFTVGLVIGANFADTFLSALPVLITAAVILFIVFIVTALTRGCCGRNNDNVN